MEEIVPKFLYKQNTIDVNKKVINSIVDLSNQTNLKVEAKDIHQLLVSYSELTNENIMEVTAQAPNDGKTEKEIKQ